MTQRATKAWIWASASLAGLLTVLTSLSQRPIGAQELAWMAQTVRIELAPSDLDRQREALDALGLEVTREDVLSPRETPGQLLERMGIQDPAAQRFLARATDLQAALRGGSRRNALIQTDRNGRLLRLQLANDSNAVGVRRIGDGEYETFVQRVALETAQELRSVEVRNSFFDAMDQARVPESITEEVVSLFESDIDFRRQVQPGDKVRVIYQVPRLAGRDLGQAQLLAVRFEASGRSYEALSFQRQPNEAIQFYDADGQSVRRGFLAAPLRFTRMTSGFSNLRLHPLFGTERAHRGIDYSAPAGTPVRAVADGTITEMGWQGGYGNAVAVQHSRRISTYYAHLSSFGAGLSVGKTVRMGEVIGYVGATGWATGPHLHYEFRDNARSVNPNRITLENPQVPTLSGETLTRFQARASELRRQLSLLDNVTTALDHR